MSENTNPSSIISGSLTTKRKQTLITITIAVVVFGGILLGLYLTDPKRQLPAHSNEVSNKK